jgi:hypothetical protein
MVANLDNTIRKWRAVRQALVRYGKQSGTYFAVHPKNSPSLTSMRNSYWNAFNNANIINNNNQAQVRAWLTQHPNKRQHITAAYNKLNNAHRELNAAAHKIMATRTLQRRWRAARSAVMNKRRATALLTLGQLTVPNMRRSVFEKAFPKPVYGPLTQHATWAKETRKYHTY